MHGVDDRFRRAAGRWERALRAVRSNETLRARNLNHQPTASAPPPRCAICHTDIPDGTGHFRFAESGVTSNVYAGEEPCRPESPERASSNRTRRTSSSAAGESSGTARLQLFLADEVVHVQRAGGTDQADGETARGLAGTSD